MSKPSRRTLKRGFTSLEYAMVLPVVLAFIFGAIDVTNYFRAQTAVKEGVHAGLRCLYPTDGSCTQSDAPQTVPVNDMYLPPFFAESKNYDGMEKHLILPNYSFGAIRAKTLTDVSYAINSTRYATERTLYNGQGEVKYFIEHLPGFFGNYQDATIRGGTPLSASGTPNGHVQCNQSQSISIGKITFDTPPAPFQNEPGYGVMDDCLSYRYGSGESYDSCPILRVKNRARLFINLKGDGYIFRNNQMGSDTGVSGHVNIELWYQDQTGWHRGDTGIVGPEHPAGSLGGQQFEAHSNENFIPRGLGSDEVGGDLNGQTSGPNGNGGVETLDKYKLILIPYNVHAEIRFTLHGMGGSACDARTDVGWRLTAAQIRIPEYTLDQEMLACNRRIPRSQCNLCEIRASDSKYFDQLGADVGPAIRSWCTNQAGADDRVESPSCFPAVPSIDTLLHARTLHSPPSDYDLRVGNAGGCPTSESHLCSSNKGVSTPSQYDSNGFSYVVNSTEAQGICPAPDYAITNTSRWNEAINTVYSDSTTLSESDCAVHNGTEMPMDLVPEDVRLYKKLILPSALYVSSAPSYKYPGDPDLLRQTSQFNCAAVGQGQIFYDEGHIQNFSGIDRERLLQSSFIGSQHQLGCNTHDILKQEAVHIGMNPAAYFEVTRDDFVAGERYQASPTAIDSCMTVEADLSLLAENLRSKVPGGPFDDGEIPSECIIQGTGRCISIPAGVREIDPGGTFSVDYKGAQTRAIQAMQAFMPSTKFNQTCLEGGGVDCGKVVVNGGDQSGQFDPMKDTFKIEASIEVPLLILANKPLTVRYSSERAWEGQYLHHTQTF